MKGSPCQHVALVHWFPVFWQKQPFISFRCTLLNLLDLTICLSRWQALNLTKWRDVTWEEIKLVFATSNSCKINSPTLTHTNMNFKWKQLHSKTLGLFGVLLFPSCQVIWRISLSCSCFFSGGIFFFSMAPKLDPSLPRVWTCTTTPTYKYSPDASPLPGAYRTVISPVYSYLTDPSFEIPDRSHFSDL